MLGIVITGHNGIAEGVLGAVRLLTGEHHHIKAVDFLPHESEEMLANNMQAAVDSMQDCSQFLVLCDILGGSPFKCAVTMFYQNPSVRVIYGFSLPMIVEAVMRSLIVIENVDLDELVKEIMEQLQGQQGSIPLTGV